jgi:hypothetical protein
MSKWVSALIVSLGITVIGAKPAFAGGAQVAASLTLTENSPTSLSLVYSGPDAQPGLFTVMNTGADLWTITVAQNLGPVSFNDFSNGWIEPENPLFVNEVTHSTTMNNDKLFVHSDLSILFNTITSPDNTGFLVGQDSGVPIFLTFHDIAASAETSTGVPDTGATLGLLGLASVGLVALSRFRVVRVA